MDEQDSDPESMVIEQEPENNEGAVYYIEETTVNDDEPAEIVDTQAGE